MISYIVDENGNKTHAVVPIDEWKKIQLTTPSDRAIAIVENASKAVKGRAIPSVLFDITALMNSLDIEKDFYEAMNSHYKYFELFDSKDIGLLYLMRTADFNMFMLLDLSELSSDRNANDVLEEFYQLFKIKNLRNNKLTVEEFERLQQIFLYSATPVEVINQFKQKFQIGVYGFSKRIRKDAEIKRLFFYDFSNSFPLIFPNETGGIGELKEIMEGIAEQIYLQNSKESAIVQMYKAIRDAKERIEQGKWKMYIGE